MAPAFLFFGAAPSFGVATFFAFGAFFLVGEAFCTPVSVASPRSLPTALATRFELFLPPGAVNLGNGLRVTKPYELVSVLCDSPAAIIARACVTRLTTGMRISLLLREDQESLAFKNDCKAVISGSAHLKGSGDRSTSGDK